MATIQIVHIPIKSGFTGAAHQFLLLTRDDGSREFIRGGPQRTPELSQIMADIVAGTNSFGLLVVHTGRYDSRTADFPVKETELGLVFDSKRFDSWTKTAVVEGHDAAVSELWAGLQQTARAIANQRLPYRPMSQNSNSLASECLRVHGIEPSGNSMGYPWGYKFDLPTWTPGAENRLSDPHAVQSNTGSSNYPWVDPQRKSQVSGLYEAYKTAQAKLKSSAEPNRRHTGRSRDGLSYGK